MHALLLIAAVPLALASTILSPRYAPLLPRQGSDAFIPNTTPVNSCDAPCGTDYCLDVSRGDTCCTEGYACPGGSFCLTEGYCCPNGDSPSNCAANFGITLPSGFTAGQTVPAGPPAAASSGSAPSTTGSVPAITTTGTAPAFTGSSPAFTLNATSAAPPHATGTGAALPGGLTFTGEASVMRACVRGIMGLIASVVGMLVL